MKHIVIDARIINSTTGTYMLNLVEHMQTVDKKNRYSILIPPKDMEYWKPKSKRFTLVSSPYKLSSASEQTRLLKQIRSLKPDLVHFTMPQQPAILGLKRVTTVHDLTPLKFKTLKSNRRKRAVYKQLLRFISQRSNAIITPSEYVKEGLAKFAHINSRKVRVIYDAADKITEPSMPIENLEGKNFISFVGRPSPHKNLAGLIDAYALLVHDHPDLHLVFAGKMNGGYRRLARYAKSKNLENVIFTDFITQGQLRWLYENSAAYVFPSHSEGFGLPGLEAMMHDCPVVSSNATCLPEVYSEAAHYFDPNDIGDMAAKINDVLTDKTLRRKLIENGRRQSNKYSWKKMAEQTFEVYESVLNS